ncbi:hypothetical protein [Streptomyces sp. Tu 3180]|uniref:hypothetical protein n=1 Tax=Streptomyces sp. Tu 3180 TaxID=2682611 RepID=UPI00135C78D5|nr:hypothetical protein [Streptomyces sp. Tu 3180]KAF3463809.1 hypothetical protein GL259_05485 [Streptomyces sp. Tu 3180]
MDTRSAVDITSCAYGIGRIVHSGTAIGRGSPNASAAHRRWARKPSGVESATSYARPGRPRSTAATTARAASPTPAHGRTRPRSRGTDGQPPPAQQGEQAAGAAGTAEQAEAQRDALQAG